MSIEKRVLISVLLLLTACTSTGTPPLSPEPSPTPTLTPIPTLTPTPTPTSTPRTSLTGRWLGGYRRADGATVAVIVSIESETNGTIAFEPQAKARALKDVVAQANRLSFSIEGTQADEFKSLSFSGQWLDGYRIVGEVVEDGAHSELNLAAWHESIQLDQYDGVYTFPSGRAISILSSQPFTTSGLNGFGGSMIYTDFETSAMRGLYPIAPDVFWVGSKRSIGYPFLAQITFDRNGSTEVAGLIWQDFDPETAQFKGEAETGTRLIPEVETVFYPSADGIILAGQLTLPLTSDPHPALVMLHGSERGQRNGFGQRLLGHFMVSQGIALLTYDKRGVGDSGGTYRESASESNLTLLAQDALAGLDYLQSRPEIDPKQIGLIGSSQAGWIIPIAASQSDEVAFFIIRSGPVVSLSHESLYSAYTNDGESPTQFSQEEITKQLALLSPSGVDPVPTLMTVQQPGLWLWGDLDKSVPIPESKTNLEALIAGGHSNFTYTIFPDADHFLLQSTQGLVNEFPFSPGYPEDYYPTITKWLTQTIK